ncbi:MAG: hypothetical protein ACI9R3_001276 [Verrucomicrobiales bacterium]|jgi:uncharacterized protein (DUF3820 family)
MAEEFNKEADRELFVQTLAEIERYRMPFGKYGPKHFPAGGVPIYDLPLDYLVWFQQKGYPKGRLGELLEIVCHAKSGGADKIFDVMRSRAGGRTKLRPGRKKEWKIED